VKLVFLGTPEFAVPTLTQIVESGHKVLAAYTQPDRPKGRGQQVSFSPVKEAALRLGLTVHQPERIRRPEVIQELAAAGADAMVVVGYGQIIPQAIIDLPRYGIINVHASLLPKYRGAAPVHRAVVAGEPETGVTIMRMVKALDAGDMLATAVRPIGPDETSDLVERDLAEMGARLLVDVVGRLEAGTVTAVPQDEARSTYAARLTKDEGLVDWTLPAHAIHNRVRGLYPWPHAYSYLDGSRIILLQTRNVEPGTRHAAPGTVVEVTREAIHVATGHDGVIAIDRLQPEGRRAMRTSEFLAGRPLQPGARFGGGRLSPERSDARSKPPREP
jgi:methionyl-tRNA formyltransferase